MGKYVEIFAYILSSLIAMAIFTSAIKKEEVKSMLKDMSSSCETPPTEEDLDALITHNPNPPQSTKCFRLCLMNQAKLLNEENKLDMDPTKQLFSLAYEDGDAVGGDIVTKCNSQVHDTELCDRAQSYSMCILEVLKANNKVIDDLED